MGNGASVRASSDNKSRTWLCAVDGSSKAHEAFLAMMALRGSGDHVIIFHAYIEHQSQLQITPEHVAVRVKYENELSKVFSLPPESYSFAWEDRRERTLRETLLDMLFEMDENAEDSARDNAPPAQAQAVQTQSVTVRRKPNFVILGYAGQNFSVGPTEGKHLGSVADLAMRSVRIPIVMIKKSVPLETRNYVMAVNGSELSRNGFNTLLGMVKSTDTMLCVQVLKSKTQADGTVVVDASAQEHYEKALVDAGIKGGRFLTLNTDIAVKSIADCLIEYVNELKPDFFALAPRSSRELSSITELMIKSVQASIILCKHK